MTEFLCTIFSLLPVLVMTYLIISFTLPIGRFALKSFENKLDIIIYFIKSKNLETFKFEDKGKIFKINIECITPVENFSYQKVIYYNIYINQELVCRMWKTDKLFTAFRLLECSTKRNSEEIFKLIDIAYEKINKLNKEDINKRAKDTIDGRSFYKD